MLKLTITELEHGWLTAKLWNGQTEAAITASYLSDAPRDLICATAGLLEGDEQARFSWMEEPGECRFLFRRIGGEIHLKILWFSDWAPHEPNSSGALVFAGKDGVHTWEKTVASEFNKLIREYGEEGYRSRWQLYDFPKSDFTRLKRAAAGG